MDVRQAFSYALASASELIHVEPAFGLRETVRLCALRRPSSGCASAR